MGEECRCEGGAVGEECRCVGAVGEECRCEVVQWEKSVGVLVQTTATMTVCHPLLSSCCTFICAQWTHASVGLAQACRE